MSGRSEDDKPQPEAAQQAADREFAISVVEQLRAAGFEALWAGGCVRDLLLGNPPADYDVATSATPTQVRSLFGNRRTVAVGAAFGVIIVLPKRTDAQQIEVATFRTDAGYSDGRRPDSVTFSTAKEDALRRDFTINGMFYDPMSEKVLDFVGGEDDLKRGVIRAIGRADARIGEDKLRMLRAIRFAARFHFELETDTAAAISRHAEEIQVVSGERIAMEVAKTLQTDRAAWAAESWEQTSLLPHILPEVATHWSSHRAESLKLLEEACRNRSLPKDWRLRLAAMLYREGLLPETLEPLMQGLRDRLKLANDDAETIRFVLASQAALQSAEQQRWSSIQPLLVRIHAKLAIQLLAVRSGVGLASESTLAFLRERLQWPARQLDPPPLLHGADLIELGLVPGPAFKDMLHQSRAMQLDDQLVDRPAAIAWLKSVTVGDRR